MRNDLLLSILIFVIVINAGDTAYQTAQTEYLRDVPKAIVIKGLSGDLRIKAGDEVFYQCITRFDAGNVDESRRLTKLTNIITSSRNDTFYITVIPPVEELSKMKNHLGSFLADKILTEYRSKAIEFSSGIEYRTDIVVEVMESVAVISDIKVGKLFLDRVESYTAHQALSTELRGVASGEHHINSDELDVQMEGIEGSLYLLSRRMELEIKKGFSGNLDINTDYADILVRSDIKPHRLALRQKRGRFTWSGETPDTLIVNATEPEFQGEFTSAGFMRINQKGGSIDLRLALDSFGTVDAETKEGKAKFRTPEGLIKGKKFMHSGGRGDGTLLLRTQFGDIEISLID